MLPVHSHKKAVIIPKGRKIDRLITLSLLVSSLTLLLAPKAAAQPRSTPPSSTIESEENTYKFGDQGETRWYVQGALATTLDRVESDPRRFGLVGAGLSKFFINGHSVNLELNTIYFDQPGNNAVGINLALLGRWHIVRRENWSFFLGGGAGVMNTTRGNICA